MALIDIYGQPFKFAHAADRSRARVPQFANLVGDIDRLISAGDRRTLASLSNTLYFNFHIIKTISHQRADFSIGDAFLPEYKGTEDSETGRAVAKYMEASWYPQCNILGGVFDWWQTLFLTSVAIDRDGDVFCLMYKGDDGYPRLQLIEGHRCHGGGDNGLVDDDDTYKGQRILDGVVRSITGRAIAYRFDVGDGKTQQFRYVPASDVIHFYDPRYVRQGRGFPIFAGCLDDIKSAIASTNDERLRQIIVSRIHLIVTNSTGGPDIDDPMQQMDSATANIGPASTVNFPGGIQYLPAESGHDIKQLRHENPGVVWEAFQDRLMLGCVKTGEWSATLAWKGPGQGSAERAEILVARQSIRRRQGILWHYRRAFAWAYSTLRERGDVPLLKSPLAWEFSRPPRLTIDDGREAKAEQEMLFGGTTNLSEILSGRGINTMDFLTERAEIAAMREIARIKAEEKFKVKIDPREMYMPNKAEQSQASQQSTIQDP